MIFSPPSAVGLIYCAGSPARRAACVRLIRYPDFRQKTACIIVQHAGVDVSVIDLA